MEDGTAVGIAGLGAGQGIDAEPVDEVLVRLADLAAAHGRRVVEAGLAAADAIQHTPAASEAMLSKVKEQIVLTLLQIY
jgi:hypothetical protein